jgi:hypothetical protein
MNQSLTWANIFQLQLPGRLKNQQQPRFDGGHSAERTERFPSNTHAAYVDRAGGGAWDMWGVEAAEDEADCK